MNSLDEEGFEEIPDEYDPTPSHSHQEVSFGGKENLGVKNSIQYESRTVKTHRYLEKKERNRQLIAEEANHEMMKGCTFHPETNHRKHPTHKTRTLQEFLHSQDKHLTRMKTNRSALKERLDL